MSQPDNHLSPSREAILNAARSGLGAHWIGAAADRAFADSVNELFAHAQQQSDAGQRYSNEDIHEALIAKAGIFASSAPLADASHAASAIMSLYGYGYDSPNYTQPSDVTATPASPTADDIAAGAAALKASSNWHAGFDDGGFNYEEAARIVLQAAQDNRDG